MQSPTAAAPKPRRLRKLALAALAASGLVAAAAPAASASHLQGGFFTATITSDGHLKGTFTYLEHRLRRRRRGLPEGDVGRHDQEPDR